MEKSDILISNTVSRVTQHGNVARDNVRDDQLELNLLDLLPIELHVRITRFLLQWSDFKAALTYVLGIKFGLNNKQIYPILMELIFNNDSLESRYYKRCKLISFIADPEVFLSECADHINWQKLIRKHLTHSTKFPIDLSIGYALLALLSTVENNLQHASLYFKGLYLSGYNNINMRRLLLGKIAAYLGNDKLSVKLWHELKQDLNNSDGVDSAMRTIIELGRLLDMGQVEEVIEQIMQGLPCNDSYLYHRVLKAIRPNLNVEQINRLVIYFLEGLQSEEALVGLCYAKAIGALWPELVSVQQEEIIAYLLQVQQVEKSDTLNACISMLAYIAPSLTPVKASEFINLLLPGLSHENIFLRGYYAGAIAVCSSKLVVAEAVKVIKQLMLAPTLLSKEILIETIGNIWPKLTLSQRNAVIIDFVSHMQNNEATQRDRLALAFLAVAKWLTPEQVNQIILPLQVGLHDTDWRVRSSCIRAIGAIATKLTSNQAYEAVQQLLQCWYGNFFIVVLIVPAAVAALWKKLTSTQSTMVISQLQKGLQSQTAYIREGFAKIICSVGDQFESEANEIIEQLLQGLNDIDINVRVECVKAISAFGSKLTPAQENKTINVLLDKFNISSNCDVFYVEAVADLYPYLKSVLQYKVVTSLLQGFKHGVLKIRTACAEAFANLVIPHSGVYVLLFTKDLIVDSKWTNWVSMLTASKAEDCKKHEESENIFINLVIIGPSGVGKSSLLHRFSDNSFSDAISTTIGIDFKYKIMEVEGKAVQLQIWDTGGNTKYDMITKHYYKGAHGFILVYDVCSVESFSSDVMRQYLQRIRTYGVENACKTLVGNKVDINNKRVIPQKQGEAFADLYGMSYFECSAKDNVNINEIFFALAKDIIRNRQATDSSEVNSTKIADVTTTLTTNRIQPQLATTTTVMATTTITTTNTSSTATVLTATGFDRTPEFSTQTTTPAALAQTQIQLNYAENLSSQRQQAVQTADTVRDIENWEYEDADSESDSHSDSGTHNNV